MTAHVQTSRLAVILFTDVVGSVSLKQAIGVAAYARLISRHDAIFQELMHEADGAEIVKDTGDGYLGQFPTTTQAVRTALAFQTRLACEPWGGQPLRVRIGIHLGEISELEADVSGRPKLIGLAADIAARVMSLALPGQTLLTRAAFDEARQSVREHPAVRGAPARDLIWMAHGRYLFAGAEEPMEVFEVGARGLAPLAAPPDTDKVRSAVPAGEEAVLGWRPGAGLDVPGRESWVLERRLGEGGFGEVWLANHRRTHDRRVFKFCFDAERLRSFKRELTLFRLLREALGERADIAKLHDIQLDRSPYFLESEFTETGNLADWAASMGGIDRVPLQTRLDLLAGTADAVAAAHSVGILHKDIKPSNILVYVDRGTPRPRLADFGIGLLSDLDQLHKRNITVSGFTETLVIDSDPSRTGTRMYAPPELLTGGAFTIQGDVYALGVVLYQLVVGDLARPLTQGWESDVADPLLREDIARCVAGRPEERFASAADLASSLRRLPQRRRERTRKRLARGAAVAGVALVILLGVAGIWIARERGLRTKVEEQRLLAEDHRRDAETAAKKADELRAVAESETKKAEEQRTLAEQRRVQAETESAKAAAVSEFLRGMLAEMDPNIGAFGRTVTVRQALDAAASRLQAEVADGSAAAHPLLGQPEVEAAIRDTIGVTYRSIGLFAEAEPHLARALELRVKSLGESNAETIESMMAMGVLRREQSRLDEAKALCEKALALAQEHLGPESRQVIHATVDLAEVDTDLGLHKEAEELNRRAADLSAKVQGPEHRDTISAMSNLALSLRDQAKFEEAEPLHRRIVDLSRKALGPEHVETLTAIGNLAVLLEGEGKPEEAEALMIQVVEARHRVLGPDHPATLSAMSNLAATRSSLGRLAEARDLYRDVIARSAAKLGTKHIDVLMSMANLASIEDKLDNVDEAQRLYEQVLATTNETVGKDHPLARNAMMGLANIHQGRGRFDLAEPLMVEAVELAKKNAGLEHPETLSCISDLAGLYLTQKKFDKAEPLFRSALEGMRKVVGDDHPETLILMNNLAAVCRDMGRLEEADALMGQVVAGARKSLPADHWYIAVFLTTQGKLQTRLKQYEKAEATLKEAEDRLEKLFGADHQRTRDVMVALAGLYDEWGRPDDAAMWRKRLPAAATNPDR